MLSIRSLMLSCLLIVVARAVPVVAEDFPNTIGWQWKIAPHEPTAFMGSRGYMMISESGLGDQFKVTLARSTSGEDSHGTQVVAFDEQRRPFRLTPRQGGGQQGLVMQRFILPTEELKASEVAYVGIEILTSRSVERATKKALAAAKKAGVEVLRFPVVGQPYAIQLTDTGGKKLTTADLMGNVVMIDCWATWCTPCVAKLPVLKEIHARHADGGLQIIGINYDQTTRAMQAVNEKLEINWSTVHVPSDEETRDLWHAVNGIMSLPRILVVDKKGVLRANFENLNEPQLENLVVRLLESKE